MKHPLYQFEYCPRCGAKAFVERNAKAKECQQCGFVYYFNPSAAVACFIRDDSNRLLFVRRGRDPGKGTLDTPGGFVDMFESGEEAARREVMEETGLELQSVEYIFSVPNIYPYKGFEVHTLDLFFECHVEDITKAVAQDDAAEICILKPKELNPDLFGLPSVKKAIALYKEFRKEEKFEELEDEAD